MPVVPCITSACFRGGRLHDAINVPIESQHTLHDLPPSPRAAAAPPALANRLCNINSESTTVNNFRIESTHQQPSESTTAAFPRSRSTLFTTSSTSDDPQTCRQLPHKLLHRRRAAAAFPLRFRHRHLVTRLHSRFLDATRAFLSRLRVSNVPSTPASTTIRCSFSPLQPQISPELSIAAI